MMKICMFLVLILYSVLHNGHVTPANICIEQLSVSGQELQENGMRTCSKTQKCLNAHNVLNFHHNLGTMLSKLLYWWEKLNWIRVFWNSRYPFLKTMQNDENLRVTKIAQKLILWSFWEFLRLITCDFKIYFINLKSSSFFNKSHS